MNDTAPNPVPVVLIPMEKLREIFGGVSRDSIDKKFTEKRMRRIKQGSYTYARSDDVAAEIDRLTREAEDKAANTRSEAA